MSRHFPGEDERKQYTLADVDYEAARVGQTYRKYEAVDPMSLAELTVDTRVMDSPEPPADATESEVDERIEKSRNTRVYLSYDTTRNELGIGKYRIHNASVIPGKGQRVAAVFIESTYAPPPECGLWLDVTEEPAKTEAAEDD